MGMLDRTDCSVLDRPEVLRCIFHPRSEWAESSPAGAGRDILIPVEEDTVIGARFHTVARDGPNILFFHGNGEIVSDYDDLAPVYNRMGINFLPVDYRGYGRSTGSPSVSSMLRDSHTIIDFSCEWLKENGYTGPLAVMGRSLGSASALELAARDGGRVQGLILESGFAYAAPLLKVLGIDPGRLGFREEEGFGNVGKISAFHGPTLIIHAEGDQIIPFSDAQVLFEHSSAADKTLVKIPNAGHNDIFYTGLSIYMTAIRTFVDGLGREMMK